MIRLLGEHGLKRGVNDLQVIMMCELPSNAVIADAFLDHFDGFSIGSNDMTQFGLGLDRDSALVSGGFDERDPAVKFMLSAAIQACKARGKYVGICGQGPSDHPDLAEWLLEQGIESMSLNPDTVVDTWLRLGQLVNSQHNDAAIQHEGLSIKSQMPPAAREITLRFLAAPTDAGYSGNVGGGRVLGGSTKRVRTLWDGPAPTA